VGGWVHFQYFEVFFHLRSSISKAFEKFGLVISSYISNSGKIQLVVAEIFYLSNPYSRRWVEEEEDGWSSQILQPSSAIL
jgi:hypothetical protein